MTGTAGRAGAACVVILALMLPTAPAQASTSDELGQWNIAHGSAYGVDAADAWSMSTGKGATIAMIDSGLTPHPDLTGSDTRLDGGNVVAGYDFVSDPAKAVDGDGWDSDPTDVGHQSDADGNDIGPFAHGEQTAGVAAALKNGFGIVGVAPEATIVPVRVTGDQWWVSSDVDIAAAIRWSAGDEVAGVPRNQHPADVVNISVAVPWGTCPAVLQKAIDAAVAKGVPVVVAAGNTWTPTGPRDTIDGATPAMCDNVIRVTASTPSGVLENYSNVGTEAMPATIAAPGSIRSLCPSAMPTCKDGYIDTLGTSMSAPHVSGVIALLRAAKPQLGVAELTSLMTRTATSFSTSCAPAVCGAGIVNAAAALRLAMGSGTPSSTTLTMSQPKVVGTAKVGRLLNLEISVSPASTRLAVRWLRAGIAIPGATAMTYRATAADLGKPVTAEVVATVGGSTVTRSSIPVTIGRGTFSRKHAPRATGTAKVGHKLSAKRGTWSPGPQTFTYQWLRDGHRIAGATKARYRLSSRDRGHLVSVRITVRKRAYVTRSSSSAKRRVH